MKQFLKMTLASALGTLAVGAAMLFVLIGIVGALASLGSTKPVMPRDGVLNIDMSTFALEEQNKEADMTAIIQGGEPMPVIGIWDAVQAVNSAAKDPSVRFIYLKTDNLVSGTAQLEEFRRALENFRSSGKAIVAYTESPGNGGYYLATVADKIYMTPHEGGMIMLHGLSSQLFFVKDALDKLGINIQLIRHGKFKSAGEMYIRNSISPENRLQNQAMVDALWGTFANEIAKARGIDVAEFNKLIDGLKINGPKDFLDNKLVDELLTKEELKKQIAQLALKSDFDEVQMIKFTDYVKLKSTPSYSSKEKIAIIYADGTIMDGKSGNGNIGGDDFAETIAKVRKDTTIKAVVFRVNSPGGSVLASEKIKNEIDLLQQTRPVIASYGNYAASGGYWISGNCDYIFSNANTLTGSIGVFSTIPDFGGVVKNKAKVGLAAINSNKHSDIYSMMRPLDNAELEYFQSSVENIYSKFTQIVAEGRDMTVEAVDEIAQGRVWAGSEAVGIGLVDKIGTIEDAVNYALIAAGDLTLEDTQVVQFPKPLTTAEQLMKLLGESSKVKIFKGTPLEFVETIFGDWNTESTGKVYAAMPYIYDIR
jgi:protease-4